MNPQILKGISVQVYKQFPELEGTKPKVQLQTSSKSSTDQKNYLLIYRGTVKTFDGRSLQRIVRIVATAQGKILKMTTSR